MLYYDAKSDRVYALSADWRVYARELDPATIPPSSLSVAIHQRTANTGRVGNLGRQTLVGGFMAGIEAMHGRFGRLGFADLFQPAIWYAENGVTVSPTSSTWSPQRQPQLWRTPEGRRFASMPNGALPKIGDLLRQPDLARTLRAVATKGAAYMYSGDWARHFDAMHIGIRGPYWRDAASFRDYIYALRFAQYGHYSPIATAFEHHNNIGGSCRQRIMPAYAAAVAPQLGSLLLAPGAPASEGHHSEPVVVVDQWGNVAALVHTINTTTGAILAFSLEAFRFRMPRLSTAQRWRD